MNSSSIPSFGAMNGVAGAPTVLTADPALNTVIAVMYNYYDPTLISDNSAGLVTNSANRIVLNPYFDGSNNATPNSVNDIDHGITNAKTVSIESFLALFYPTNAGYFNVNPTNANNPAIILSKQTYTSTNNNASKFSLVQYLLKSYCTNKGINVNDLDPRIMVLLQKEAFSAQTLASIKGTTISMSWDEVINTLLRSGVIDVASLSTNTAIVPLSIILNYHSFVLDTDLSIRFTYMVEIPSYMLPTTPPAL